MRKTLIIGATSAIAQAIADQLAQTGADLFLVARSAPRLDLIARDLAIRHNIQPATAAIDFDDFAQYPQVIDRAIARLGGLDLAIICHGSLPDQQACEADPALADAQFRINALSPISFAAHIASHLQQRRAGCIIVISSVAGDRGRGSNYIYGAAKSALTTYLAGLRNRLHSSGVRVITVKPGFVDTPMTSHLKRGLLTASPATVARDIVRAAEKGNGILYTPWFWRPIMLIIRLIPEPLFIRLNL